MKKFIQWMNESFAPRMNKITRNAWVSAIQEAIMGVLPLILVGSLITLISILNDFISGMPNLQPISDFSFGLMSLFIAFLTPYFIMDKLKKTDRRLVAGLTGAAMFLMLLAPEFTDEGAISFAFERFGANGMFVSLFVGLLVGFVFYQFSKFSFFKSSSSLPDFIIVWFDTILPITLLLLGGWLFTFVWDFDLYLVIISLFEPLNQIGQSFVGFVLITFLCVFLYTFGISPWALYPIIFPIWVSGVEQNAANVSQSIQPENIHVFETMMAWVWIGGMGTTLPLVVLMVLLAKSKHLKAIGRVTIVPSIFNINEPVIFGSPIAFNPILMVPMWLNGIIIPVITYVVLNLGMVTIPSEVLQLWYLPVGISTFLVNTDFRGLILLVLILVVSFIIWYPFFKVYDNQKVKEEATE
ncbi:PTS transporter subunit EIIC [Agaribacter marinus]|uniref:Permease IIC component n=1 Tax=Virgibacillus salarius TaxID=447199 RepID=A0A941DVI5_9BACI|nr:PTS transporter subunit EIIC [Virgibacillus salarius]MBR7796122.1 PTS sugar transporter subunit IIC [Virgibacillus salarius]NAZ08831.1 PTS transporter subunit EIIC [Agaribacter marinus]WBX81490.1 PTS transporter subunit EIIC [Virgibacillus salarius]